MAYAALMTLSKAIDLILPQDHEYTFLCEKEQMQSLQNEVICLQEFLEHVSRRPSSRNPLEVMERRIRETAYQLEDIVESIIVGSFQQDVSRKSFYKVLASRCVPHCGTSATSIPVQKAVDRTIAAFTSCIEKVDVLIKDSMEMKEALNSNIISKTIFSGTKECSSSEPPATNTNVGLEDDFIQILDRITNDVSSLQIIPITGMGGIGKTTLARAVYEHPGLQSHFDLRIWVTVSQEWYIQEILQGLLGENGAQNEPVGSLSLRVHKKLYGRRYLIVLDDVWDEDAWNRVRIAFPDGNEKSRVIVTTRLMKLGRYVIDSSGQLHEKKFLSHEQSWNLLRKKVYGHEDCPVELANIGRTISSNCKGLPLAVVVIGGLLKFNKTKNYWEEVAHLTTVRASMGDEYLLEILSLSYTNLPPHLKACFLYFVMFREDKEIQTEELVRLWSAEGFLKPRESKTIEAVAEECLEELVERSLVLVKKRRYDGKIKTSSIHDVLRDFSLRESEKENFLHYCAAKHIDRATYGKIMKEQRRVSFLNHGQFSSSATYTTDETLVRSFINDGDYSQKVRSISFIDLKLLRVLRVRWTINYPLSILCSRLTNLRYLELELELEDGEEIIPKSISKLRNLETLIISTYSDLLIILPLEIWMMPRLRHLILSGGVDGGMRFPEPSVINGSSLESLQTLSGVTDQCFTTSVIDKIRNLRRLEIKYENLEDANECGLDNLVDLHSLQNLSISCYSGPGLTNFVFPQKLKELSLFYTKIPWEKMVSIGELPHLQWLDLWGLAFVGEVWEPSEGGFCQLKNLGIFGLDLEEWRAESTHFPCLEELEIHNCPNLKEVPIEIGEIDTLKKLTVYTGGGKKSLKESVERIKYEQESNGNDSLQVIFN